MYPEAVYPWCCACTVGRYGVVGARGRHTPYGTHEHRRWFSIPARERQRQCNIQCTIVVPQYKSGPFLSGFDGLSRPSSKSYNAFFVLFLSYLAIHEFLKTDGTDWAGIGAAVWPWSPTRMLGSRATLRAVCARFQPADGTHGLLVHRVLGVEKLLLWDF